MKQVKKCWLGVLWALVVMAGVVRSEDAAEILNQIHFAPIDRVLGGQLRKQDGTSVPFQLRLSEQQMTYEFSDPAEIVQVRLDENSSTLSDQTGGRTQVITGRRLFEAVRGTDFSFEDLALKFIYARSAKIESEDQIKFLPCWVIVVQPSSKASQYASVRLWIAKKGKSLLRAIAYDPQGRELKRIEILQAQEIEGKWLPRQVRVERIDPGSGRAISRTYLELKA